MTLASPSARLLGQMLDAAIGAAPPLLLLLAIPFDELAGPLALAAALLGVGYYLLCDALPGGQSVGKRLLGLAVVDVHTRRPCGVRQSIARNLLLALLGPIDWLFIFGARRQRLGDVVAGTVVVRVP